MDNERLLIVEFIAVFGLVLAFAIGASVLVLYGVDDDNGVVTALVDGVKVGFGAVIALAYAARGIVGKGDK